MKKAVDQYLSEHNLQILETKVSPTDFVYIITDATHPRYRYSLHSPEMLQHEMGRNDWRDIWLGVREEQIALF